MLGRATDDANPAAEFNWQDFADIAQLPRILCTMQCWARILLKNTSRLRGGGIHQTGRIVLRVTQPLKQSIGLM